MGPPALSALTTSAESGQSEAIHDPGLWRIIAAVAAIDATWLRLSGLQISVSPVMGTGFLALIAFGAVYSTVKPDRHLASFAATSTRLAAFNVVAIVLSYLVASVHFPLVDDTLAATDRALGFDWLAFFDWTKISNPTIGWALDLIYDTIVIQVLVLLIALGATGQAKRAREFSRLFAVTLLLIIPLSMLLPAEGAWAHYGVARLTSAYYLPDFYAIRSGAMHVIDLGHVTGIVQFPSFHAALGLILILSARGTFLFIPYLALNIVMIASALTSGGHYLTDVIIGLAMVPATILILRAGAETQKGLRIPLRDTGAIGDSSVSV
ncbi:phosphatase PAP2 family protein [Bradyrhizobium sp. Arg62]|uniref:phosphatase PAP2 family protein n=1 Tax=Bradyrhizobium brasilense TaxID=1419277 RepID=UPI001E5B0EF5|nr:phosphatase PAP2 family protein [Bradyrhizobium brasilense]MCC8948771.1 phosphatase PAP2 family protein [Bradyrhizobium brasilense]